MATRLAGSSDLYQGDGRGPDASINFITCHDGFTLRDLVSYTRKHNDANGENNNDGESHNLSMNFGVEGETADPAIIEARARQMRSFFATLFLSQGVPMMLAGDEIGRTQAGNNNAYCQDNALSWVSWNLTPPQQSLLDFVRALIAHRHAHPILRRRHFFEGRRLMAGMEKDITWFDANGEEMTSAGWGDAERRTLGMRLFGIDLDEPDVRGVPFIEDVLFVLFHASDTPTTFMLPACPADAHWVLLLDTAMSTTGSTAPLITLTTRTTPSIQSASAYPLQGRSVVLLRQERQIASAPAVTSRGRSRPRRRASDYRSR